MHWSKCRGLVLSQTKINPQMLTNKGYTATKKTFTREQDTKNHPAITSEITFDSDFVKYRLSKIFSEFKGVKPIHKARLVSLLNEVLIELDQDQYE